MKFLKESSDVKWLEDVHLKALAGFHGKFKSFTIIGNEDSPERIHIYAAKNPSWNDEPVASFRLSDTGLNYERYFPEVLA